MADETTLTQPATETSATTTNEPAAVAPVPAPEAEAKEPAAETETSVLGGEVTEDEKPAEEAPAPVVPETYELALEGVDLDAALIEEATPIFKDLGLTNDQANALLPLAPKIMEKAQQATMQALLDAGAQQRQQWLEAYKADPDIGGARAEETEHLAAKGLDALGFGLTGHGEDGKQPHPFRKALTESGFGNHPDMIRAFRRLGEMVGEDGGFVRPGAEAKPTISIEKRLYPND